MLNQLAARRKKRPHLSSLSNLAHSSIRIAAVSLATGVLGACAQLGHTMNTAAPTAEAARALAVYPTQPMPSGAAKTPSGAAAQPKASSSAAAQPKAPSGAAAQPKASSSAAAQPKAPSGAAAHYRRYVIELPALPGQEDAHKIELIAGRVMIADCNQRSLGGSFASRDLSGWGYPYWVFESAKPDRGSSTRMACPPGSPRQTFVAAPSAFALYNSHLPLVVYLPKNFELRWRVWQVGAQQSARQR
jgi:ecotin